MEPKMWELMSLIEDAKDCLERAAAMAGEMTGAGPESGLDGWQEMERFCDTLGRLSALVGTVTPYGILQAAKDEADEDDRLSDLADAASY